jgi:Domain of unknown function (DUF4062)
MDNIFISSTFQDLVDHRKVVVETLNRMKRHYTAMEFFGSRTDEAVSICQVEIGKCSLLIGIYAWRYGWVPQGTDRSITEQEFDYARELNKPCLCYVIDENHPWPPIHIDTGQDAERLRSFKEKVSQLVRAVFTTPDNLAKQIAADVGRELAEPRDPNTVGGLLQINWDCLSPELQIVILDAYKRAKEASSHGVVSTRHVIAAMEALPNSSNVLLQSMPRKIINEVQADSAPAIANDDSLALAEIFQYDKPFSDCVLGSLHRLLPSHSSHKRLLAIEVAADILKNGRSNSVRKFRRAGIDGTAVERLMRHAERISNDFDLLRNALKSFDMEEVALLRYEIGLTSKVERSKVSSREELLADAAACGKLAPLAGEIMRRRLALLREVS